MSIWLKKKIEAFKRKRLRKLTNEIKRLYKQLKQEELKTEELVISHEQELVGHKARQTKLEELLKTEKTKRAAERSGYFRDMNILREQNEKLLQRSNKVEQDNQVLKHTLGIS